MSSLLITNCTLVTMKERQVLRDGALYIEGTRIVAVGPSSALTSRYQAEETIDGRGKIVMPGLIDTHYHTCQQFLRGTLSYLTQQGQTHYPVWKNYLVPFESLLTEDDVHLSGLAAYANMIKVGTTCVSEHGGRYPHELGRAMRQAGLRGLLAQSTMDIADPELPTNMVWSTEEAIERNLDLVRTWNERQDEPIRGCFSLRQIIVCTPRLIQAIARLAEEHNALIQTHLAEGTYEVEYAVNRYSLRCAEYLESLGALSPRLLCAHSVLLSDHEVELYARYGVKVAHCPQGNFSGLGMAKLPLMRRLGVPVGIGSDGASGGSIDLFPLMNLSLVGQQLYYGTPYLDRRAASAYDCVAMATSEAAAAVCWDDEIGTLEPGKRADLIVLDTSHLDVLPMLDDVYYTIVKCLRGRDVETVVVNGRLLLKNRRLLTIDEDDLRREIAERVPFMCDRFEVYHRQRKWN